jgi:ribosome-binding factor A
LTEIIADHFERVDDDDLGFLTITGAEVDNDLNVCQVFVSTLAEPDPEGDRIVLDALTNHRKDVQRAIARQAKLRKTPDVVFAFDPAVRSGARIESILATLDIPLDSATPDDSATLDDSAAPHDSTVDD